MKSGERYTIRNSTPGGKELIEGEAVLVGRADTGMRLTPGTEVWMVRFAGDEKTYRRLVRAEDFVSKR